MNSLLKRSSLLGLIAAAVCWAGQSALAHDHLNLEEGIPTQIEDAFPVSYMGREIQGSFRYERTDDAQNRYNLHPRLEYGFLPNWQASLVVPVLLGATDNRTSGNIELDALYNINWETQVIPAFALAGGVEFPTGKDAAGVDTKLKLILTKTLSRSSYFHRVHLNLVWFHNADPRSDERENRYQGILGYQVRLDPNNMIVADVLREQEREATKTSNIAELGLRHQWNPLTVLAVGFGAGFANESPDFRATVGFQYGLNVF